MRFHPAVLVALTALVAACGAERSDETATPPASASPSATSTPEARTAMFTPQTREFRDWRAVCDNLGRCAAYGANGMRGGWAMVSREAGAQAAPRITAGTAFSDDDDTRLRLDGRAFDRGGDPLAQARALAQGGGLTLSQGEESVEVSLSGAAAALLWMDEKQGRIGTPTAIMRPGDGASAAVPGPAAPPAIAPAPPVSQAGAAQEGAVLPSALARLPDVRACTAEQMPGVTPIHSAARLSEGRYLWGVECFRGAYNLGQRFWITGEDGADPRPAEFPSALGDTTHELVNAAYDPETSTLNAFARGRGLGDCGLIQHWAWTGERFVLIFETTMQECAGMTPDNWPTLYRAGTP